MDKLIYKQMLVDEVTKSSELKSKLEVAHEKNVDLSIALKNAEKEKEELEEAKKLMPPEIYEAEFECSFDSSGIGSI